MAIRVVLWGAPGEQNGFLEIRIDSPSQDTPDAAPCPCWQARGKLGDYTSVLFTSLITWNKKKALQGWMSRPEIYLTQPYLRHILNQSGNSILVCLAWNLFSYPKYVFHLIRLGANNSSPIPQDRMSCHSIPNNFKQFSKKLTILEQVHYIATM